MPSRVFTTSRMHEARRAAIEFARAINEHDDGIEEWSIAEADFDEEPLPFIGALMTALSGLETKILRHMEAEAKLAGESDAQDSR